MHIDDVRDAAQLMANAFFYGSTLTNADLSGAVVTGAWVSGLTEEQLYSTASYQAKNLAGINLAGNDLSSWDFNGQVVTRAKFGSSFTDTSSDGQT